MPPAAPHLAWRVGLKLGLAAALVWLLVWSWRGTGMHGVEWDEAPGYVVDFAQRMWPPDLSWTSTTPRPFEPPLRLAAGAVAVTLQISLLGTALATVAALVLGLLAAENLTPHWVHHPLKMFLAVLRSVPIILLAVLFVSALGLGPVPGVLAVAVHSIGMLGKLFAEECETVEPGVWEAMDSAGAGWLQKVRYAIWPQVAAQIWSLTLFRLDMNLRESAVLGLVGVAGLGLWIEQYRKVFDYQSMATLVIVTMVLVLAVDQVSFHLRRWLK